MKICFGWLTGDRGAQESLIYSWEIWISSWSSNHKDLKCPPPRTMLRASKLRPRNHQVRQNRPRNDFLCHNPLYHTTRGGHVLKVRGSRYGSCCGSQSSLSKTSQTLSHHISTINPVVKSITHQRNIVTDSPRQERSNFLALAPCLVSLWSIQIFQCVSSRRRLPTSTGAFIFHLDQAAVHFLRLFDTSISKSHSLGKSFLVKAVCYRNSGFRSTPRHSNYHPHRCPQDHYAHRANLQGPNAHGKYLYKTERVLRHPPARTEPDSGISSSLSSVSVIFSQQHTGTKPRS